MWVKTEVDDAIINYVFWNYLKRTRELEMTQVFISKEVVKGNMAYSHNGTLFSLR